MLPANNAWNTAGDLAGGAPDSSTLIASINAAGKTKLHPDFGGNGAYGIPFAVVPSTQAKVPINYTAYGDESDPGPFPIPAARRSKVAARATATGTCWSCSRERVISTSSVVRSGRATTGTPTSV